MHHSALNCKGHLILDYHSFCNTRSILQFHSASWILDFLEIAISQSVQPILSMHPYTSPTRRFVAILDFLIHNIECDFITVNKCRNDPVCAGWGSPNPLGMGEFVYSNGFLVTIKLQIQKNIN